MATKKWRLICTNVLQTIVIITVRKVEMLKGIMSERNYCASNYEAPTRLTGHCIRVKHIRDTDMPKIACPFKFIKETARILANAALQGRID